MKKIIILLCAFLGTLHVNAENDVPAILFFHNDSIIQSFLRSDVDSMRYSYIDINGEKQNEVVTQLVYLKDTIIQIPLAEIDSVVYTPPSYSNELYLKVTTELHDYLKSHEGVVIEDVQSYLEKYSELVTTKIINNVMYINVDNSHEFICDPLMETCVGESEGELHGINIEELMGEINNALYPEETTEEMGSAFVRKDYSGTRASSGPVMLSKRKILFWDPFNMNTRLKGFDQIADTGNSLDALNTLSNYDVAVLFCHGESRDGMMGVPASFRTSLGEDNYVDGIIGTGEKTEKILFIKESKLRQLIGANDLSHTIVFMSMCHSDTNKSMIKKILNSHNVAAFAGANNTMDNGVVDFIFNFVNEFYLTRAFASNIIMSEFGSDSSASPIRKSYTTRNGVSGTYSYYYTGDIYYEPSVTAMSAVENKPRASIILPYELAVSASATRNFSQSRVSYADVSAGFWIRNKETGETMEWDFSDSSIELYHRYDYKTMTSRIEVLRVTDDMEDGTYEYRTYLKINGEKMYSENIYEFVVKRINKVVPEWILEAMKPYIPIYEGDNPPTVEGAYLMSPQTLSYDSNPDSKFKPGDVFADNYLIFYDQDKSKNTINYESYEVNDSELIIGYDYGPGAFISGEGDNFSIFFNTTGEAFFDDGNVSEKLALIISGTMTSAGIKDLYYSFVMIDKNDPNNHLMDIGDYRVFKDGDGLAEIVEIKNESQARVRRSGPSRSLPSCVDNGSGVSLQMGVSFDEWKKKWDRKMQAKK